jgi:hypothetical protein
LAKANTAIALSIKALARAPPKVLAIPYSPPQPASDAKTLKPLIALG